MPNLSSPAIGPEIRPFACARASLFGAATLRRPRCIAGSAEIVSQHDSRLHRGCIPCDTIGAWSKYGRPSSTKRGLTL